MQQGSHRQAMKDGDEQSGGYTTARSTVMPPATMRKGPWTEEEDAQLGRFVRLFGERRWDFLAKVSGLRRTGKSCRLRWVNYLHPGLRRGRITADEERLILELHGKWGSRWSRIARSLPGRTDNEIKNFWRTRTRKKALEQRRHGNGMTACSSSSSLTSGSSGSPNNSGSSSPVSTESSALQERSGDDEADLEEATATTAASQHHHQQQQQQYQEQEHCYSYTMDQLWNEIAAAEAASASYVVDSWEAGGHGGAAVELPSSMLSPVWEFCSDYYSLWRIDDDEYYKKMLDAS